MPHPPCIVIDTNAVLDWLVFGDRASFAFGKAIVENRLTWLATSSMRTEFDDVLSRPTFAAFQHRVQASADSWATHARMVDAPEPIGPLRCRDPDDQIFIDLALRQRCMWLITRDRALLALAGRARAWGVLVVTPAVLAASAALATGPVPGE